MPKNQSNAALDAVLLLVTYDELVHLWDGLCRLVQTGDIGDPAYAEIKLLKERIAEKMFQ